MNSTPSSVAGAARRPRCARVWVASSHKTKVVYVRLRVPLVNASWSAGKVRRTLVIYSNFSRFKNFRRGHWQSLVSQHLRNFEPLTDPWVLQAKSSSERIFGRASSHHSEIFTPRKRPSESNQFATGKANSQERQSEKRRGRTGIRD